MRGPKRKMFCFGVFCLSLFAQTLLWAGGKTDKPGNLTDPPAAISWEEMVGVSLAAETLQSRRDILVCEAVLGHEKDIAAEIDRLHPEASEEKRRKLTRSKMKDVATNLSGRGGKAGDMVEEFLANRQNYSSPFAAQTPKHGVSELKEAAPLESEKDNFQPYAPPVRDISQEARLQQMEMELRQRQRQRQGPIRNSLPSIDTQALLESNRQMLEDFRNSTSKITMPVYTPPQFQMPSIPVYTPPQFKMPPVVPVYTPPPLPRFNKP